MRLELSARTDLALRALRELEQGDRHVPRRHLAGRLRTSPDFLARVMGPLVAQGWIESKRGRAGGYHLKSSGRKASVLDVIQVEEGVPTDRCVLRLGPCSPDESCALHEPWMKARDAMLAELSTAPAVGDWRKDP